MKKNFCGTPGGDIFCHSHFRKQEYYFFCIGKNVIFEVDMNSSGHIDNKEKDILILGKGPINGLDDTMCYQQKLNIQLIFQDQIENFV